MKLSEFQAKATGLKKPEVALVGLAQAAEEGKGEGCARAMAEMLRWICCRCSEVGWTFQEVAEMAVGDGSEGV